MIRTEMLLEAGAQGDLGAPAGVQPAADGGPRRQAVLAAVRTRDSRSFGVTRGCHRVILLLARPHLAMYLGVAVDKGNSSACRVRRPRRAHDVLLEKSAVFDVQRKRPFVLPGLPTQWQFWIPGPFRERKPLNKSKASYNGL
jgi:hypothetical protein